MTWLNLTGWKFPSSSYMIQIYPYPNISEALCFGLCVYFSLSSDGNNSGFHARLRFPREQLFLWVS